MAYFSQLPVIIYNTRGVPNVTVRAKFSQDLLNARLIYHPYKLEDGDRPENIAEYYYGDPGLEWLVLLANNIIDVKNQWLLSQQQFQDYIDDTYGSMENATSTIIQYTINQNLPALNQAQWFSLDNSLKKYWSYNEFLQVYTIIDNEWNITPITYQNLSAEEQSYWVAQNALKYEEEANEAKRSIRLVDSDYVTQLKQALTSIMQDAS